MASNNNRKFTIFLAVLTVSLLLQISLVHCNGKPSKEEKQNAVKAELLLKKNVEVKVGNRITPNLDAKASSSADNSNNQNNNNGTKEEDWSTAPAEHILFPETYLSSIKRVLENASENSSLLPITKGAEPKKVEGNTVKSLKGKGKEDEEETAEVVNKLGLPVANNSVTANQCSKAVDLIFLLDSSESVKYESWNQVIKFVKDLCDRFSLSLTRLGVIRYDSEAEIALPLTHFPDTLSRDTAIDNIFYKTGGTRTDIALEKCVELLHTAERRKASQVLIVVTDGPSNKLEINKNNFVEGKDLVHAPAELLKEEGVAIFGIGVEPDSQTPREREEMKEELDVIASAPVKSHIFIADGYRQLQRKVSAISKAACVVNGGWSIWSEYSPCSVTCGTGTKVRMRTCTNPVPENNGADCTGSRIETQNCDMGPCSQISTQVGQIINLFANGNLNVPPAQTGTAQQGQQNVLEENQLDVKKTGCPAGIEEVKLEDDQMMASSTYRSNKTNPDTGKEYAPPNARLYNIANKGAWCAGENGSNPQDDSSQFLQIDLKKAELIGMIATQGSHAMDRWVKKYLLRYSEDGSNWLYYKNKTELEGNNDHDGVTNITLIPPIKARYLQLNPLEFNKPLTNETAPKICMRVGVFKCATKETQRRSSIPNSTHDFVKRLYKAAKRDFYKRSQANTRAQKRVLSKLRKVAKHMVKKMKYRTSTMPIG
eukprot:gene10768-11921_t